MDEMNVKVAVRVRPLLPKEKLASETNCVRVIPSTNQLVLGKDRAFTFDHVLSSKTAQEDVYEKCVAPLVKSCFEGYNCTVFAYGQTGSGKTYTVGGGNIASQTGDEFGVIPRAITDIFQLIQNTTDKLLTTKVSYIEIYKEELRDLLDLETSSKDLHLREDEEGNTMIMGVTEVECESLEQVMALLEQGSSYRHTASTQMNDVSSRSHSIFTIFLEQKWADGDTAAQVTARRTRQEEDGEEEMNLEDLEHYIGSKFHFVDLAGSERAHRTGNIGDRFKESVHINSGLLALGNVISALGDPKRKATHVPYRESKITRLLKDSLGGNAQTLMICCISPSSSNFDESLNALKYANRAKNIRNKPIINRDPHSIRFEEMQCEILALREELQKQRMSLMTATALGDTDMRHAIEHQGTIKQLEQKVIRLQTECDHYRMVAEEAYRHLLEIQDRDVLSHSLNIRLKDWLELMEEIKNKVPATLNKDAWQNHTITRLEQELHKCRSDLKSDEEIFAEKVKEVAQLAEQNAKLVEVTGELTKTCEQYEARMKTQEEQMVQREVRLQDLQARIKELESVSLSGDFDLPNVSGPPTTNRRAKSVPAHMLGRRSARHLAPDSARNIHTSPAVFSLERVMQGFRARSQLINSRLEDSDDVMQQLFSEEEDEEEDGEDDVDAVFTEAAQPRFERNTQDRSTYKVRAPKSRVLPQAGSGGRGEAGSGGRGQADVRASQTDDEKLGRRQATVQFGGTFSKGSGGAHVLSVEEERAEDDNTHVQRKRLKRHELEVRQSTQRMRDLSINIKMKEQLIKELVKSSRDAHSMNEQYKEKLEAMEREKQAARRELAELQQALRDVETRELSDKAHKDRLQGEFRKKMETAKIKITQLQEKQKDTKRLASITGHNEKRIGELEGAVDKMRAHQAELQKRLKDEVDKKAKLERDMEREQARVKELELRTEQQSKVLKVKTHEVTAMQRRLRGTANQPNREDQSKVEEQRKMMDQEMDKILEQRARMEQLEKELQQREDIVAKKEAMLAERSELEIKKLRSSQVLSKDLVTVSSRLQTVEKRLEEKAHELDGASTGEQQARVRDELHALAQGRQKLRKQRAALDSKLQDGSLLNTQEERRLLELDEAVDALDAAIEYKNEAIKSARQQIRHSTALSQSNNLLSRLSTLSAGETRVLLSKYFEKVIDLRESQRKKALECSALQMRIEEQERTVQELEASVQRQGIDMDRRLTQQQQQYEQKIQMLMQQLMETAGSAKPSGDTQAKIQQLEKDLYYYKKTSRDLKKKLRELMSSHLQGQPDAPGMDMELASSQESLYSNHGRNHPVAQPAPPSEQRPGDAGGPRDASTPVRISRTHLRRISDQEVKLRKSQCDPVESPLPTDSLEVGAKKNPWN